METEMSAAQSIQRSAVDPASCGSSPEPGLPRIHVWQPLRLVRLDNERHLLFSGFKGLRLRADL